LGVSTLSELQRQCELATSTHRAAECLFFTLGGAQVDAGAIVGWHRVIQPSLDELKIWPFDGVLEDLLAEPGVTIAEIYPADGCGHLDIKIGSGTGRTKTKRPDRQESFRHCLERFTGGPIRLSKPARSWAEWGFMREDDFDAMVGLLSTLLIVTDARRTDVPQDAYVRGIEGWILGQEFMNGSSR
jgi:hypothetical protein